MKAKQEYIDALRRMKGVYYNISRLILSSRKWVY